jgi:hypothetical protein
LAGPDPTPADSHWLIVDVMTAHLGGDEETQRMAVADLARGDDSRSAALMAGPSDCAHPQTVEVLEALARYHPDPAAAKAARKAAMQARSRMTVERQATESVVAPRGEVYQLKITLEDVEPPVWRRIQVPSSIDLAELHAVTQTAMGWTNSHLHMFEIDGERYADPEWVDGAASPDGIHLADLVGEGEQLEYVYDFGDDWRHRVLSRRRCPRRPRSSRCVWQGGGRARQRTSEAHGGTPSSCRHTTIRRTTSINSSANGPEMASMRRPSTPRN